MSESSPEGDVRVVAHDYTYEVSDDWVERQIDQDGLEPPRRWHISFELRELPDAATRKRARLLRDAWREIPGIAQLAVPTDDPLEFLSLLEHWLESREDSAAARSRLEARQRDEQRAFNEEMAAWIDRYGSARLRLASQRGYKVTSAYARARGKSELPGAWIDTADRASFRERVDPSSRALRLETDVRAAIEEQELGLSTKIVWLVEPPSSMTEHYEMLREDYFVEEDFSQQEALLMTPFLGKYQAFLPVDPDERAPADMDPDDADEDDR